MTAVSDGGHVAPLSSPSPPHHLGGSPLLGLGELTQLSSVGALSESQLAEEAILRLDQMAPSLRHIFGWFSPWPRGQLKPERHSSAAPLASL